MFLPVILADGVITSELTLFVIATVSVVQLIFMSEVGGLLLGSKIPVNFLDLVVIFLLRTLIALPIVAGIGTSHILMSFKKASQLVAKPFLCRLVAL